MTGAELTTVSEMKPKRLPKLDTANETMLATISSTGRGRPLHAEYGDVCTLDRNTRGSE